jgi:hypothetical protein
MFYIGIDPSLSSTAMCIMTPEKKILYFNYTTNSKVHKWRKLTETFVKYVDVNHRSNEDYSIQEIYKLQDYTKTAQLIIEDIIKVCGENDKIIAIESFSQQSLHGHIIDLVMFSTVLRKEIFEKVSTNIRVIAPKSLKTAACRLSYETDKKGVCRNHNGLAGGHFVKHNMLESLMDSGKESPLIKCLKEVKAEIMPMKTVPAPFSDLTDSEQLLWMMLSEV